MKLNFKKSHPNAVTPVYSTDEAAGLDLVATDVYFRDGSLVCETGIHVEIPKGYAGFLMARSSISKYDLVLANGIGLIDSDYRGQLMFKFKPAQRFDIDGHVYDADSISMNGPIMYKAGDKIGQLVIKKIEHCELVEVDNLNDTERGTGGFGSTGI